MEAVRLPEGDDAESEEVKIHYQGFREGEEKARLRHRWATRTSWGMARKIFTPERIRWAVANLAPYKAPGVDEVYPAILQEGIEIFIDPHTFSISSTLKVFFGSGLCT